MPLLPEPKRARVTKAHLLDTLDRTEKRLARLIGRTSLPTPLRLYVRQTHHPRLELLIRSRRRP